MNTFGNILRLTGFGESHGVAVGGVLDGFPSGVKIDLTALQKAMDRRSPAGRQGSGRKEADKVEILSGVLNTGTDKRPQWVSLGTPLAFIIRNTDARSEDYAALKHAFRPGHADDTWFYKYGLRDWRGGGRASARETAARVAAGAFAEMFLQQALKADKKAGKKAGKNKALKIETVYEVDEEKLAECRAAKDSVGGIVECAVRNMPRNLGEPVFDKLTSRLAQAMMSIPAARGFEIGMGFAAASMKGSEHNDVWKKDGTTCENLCGGVRGGISTGEDLMFRVAFKPIASIGQKQNLLTEDGRLVPYEIKGRHDVCCVMRAAAVVHAMTALVLADLVLQDRCARLKTL